MKGKINKPNRDWADVAFAVFMAILGLAFIAGAAKAAGPVVITEGARVLQAAHLTGQSSQSQHSNLPEEDRLAARHSVVTPTCVPVCETPTTSASSSGQPTEPATVSRSDMWIQNDPRLCLPPTTTTARR